MHRNKSSDYDTKNPYGSIAPLLSPKENEEGDARSASVNTHTHTHTPTHARAVISHAPSVLLASCPLCSLMPLCSVACPSAVRLR